MGIWRALIAWLLRSKVARIISVILAGLAAVLAYGFRQRSKGSSEGKAEILEEMRHADNSRARQVRDAVDAVRRDGGVRKTDDRGYRD